MKTLHGASINNWKGKIRLTSKIHTITAAFDAAELKTECSGKENCRITCFFRNDPEGTGRETGIL